MTEKKEKIDQKTWRAMKRAETRWSGAVKIMALLKRGVPELDTSANGMFSLQQKYGI